MGELFLLFLIIFIPTGVMFYTVKEQRALTVHRQFIAKRIGKQATLTEKVKQQANKASKIIIDRYFNFLIQKQFFKKLLTDIEFSEVSINPNQYLMFRLVLPIMLIPVFVLIKLLPLAGLALLFWGFHFIKMFLGKRSKLNKSLNQLPDLIGMISSALKAGNSLFSCFSFVADEMPAPTKNYFHQLYTELQYGIPFKQASYKMLIPLSSIPEYCMFVSAVNIQRESGGNLSEVLEILSTTIRERLKMKAKISALTGQSRMTGYVIGAAPTLMLVGLSVFNYKFVEPLYVHNTGKLLLGVAVVMQIIGFIVIKKIVDIRV